jgi:hypothetical protein
VRPHCHVCWVCGNARENAAPTAPEPPPEVVDAGAAGVVDQTSVAPAVEPPPEAAATAIPAPEETAASAAPEPPPEVVDASAAGVVDQTSVAPAVEPPPDVSFPKLRG